MDGKHAGMEDGEGKLVTGETKELADGMRW
jgi:hypothetical protein